MVAARGKLLAKENVNRLRFLVGVKVADAVGACLVGMGAFGLREGDAEEEGEVAARLQGSFYERVVGPLGGCCV